MADVRRVIEIDVKTSAQAVAAMRSIAQQTEAMENRFSAVSAAARSVGGALAGIFSVGAVIQSIRATANAFDEMGKRAERVGTTTEALSALTYQARLADVQAEQLDTAMVKLAGNIADVGKASSAGAQALERLGITTKDPAQAMEQIAEAFAAMETGSKKTALAVDIFGKAGAQLIPMLNEGAAGMKRAREEAEALGLIVSEDAAKAAQQFNDNMTRLGATLEGVRNRAVTPLIGALADLTNAFLGAGTQSLSFMDKAKLAFSGEINIGKFFELRQELERLEKEMARVADRTFAEKLVQGYDAARRTFLTGEIARIKTEIAEIERLTAARNKMGAAQSAEANRARVVAQERETQAERERREREAERARREAERAEKARVQAFKSAADDAARAAQEISDSVASFTSATTIGAVEALNAQLARLAELEAEGAIRAEVAAEAREKLTRQLLRQGDAHEELEAELRDEADTAERLAARRQALDDRLYEGTIAVEAYTRKVRELDKAQDTLSETTDKSASDMMKLGEAIQRSIEGWAGRAADAVLDFAHGVETSISSMVTNVLREFERMALQMLVMDPIFKAFAASMRGLIPGGGGAAAFAEAQGAAFAHGGQRLAFGAGGVVTRPTLFGFAGGTGLMGEAGPEAIMPLKRTPSGSLGVEAASAGVTVNVINNAGAEVGVREGRDANGGRVVTVMVEQAVQDAFARGRFDSIMSATYGMNRRGR